MQCQFMKFQAC